jgi:hypothetical protein
MESRNIVLAVLIAVIALGVFYMIDPTMGGLLGKSEGFADVIKTKAAPSSNGAAPTDFPVPGAEQEEMIAAAEHAMGAGVPSPMAPSAGTMATEGFESLSPSPMPFAGAEKPANCYPKNQLAPQELLPNDPNSKWAQVNPMGAGDIAGKNFLNAGALIGVDTIGQSNKNASWDIRSIPANPQVNVSPWLQSTIEPDLSRRPLE